MKFIPCRSFRESCSAFCSRTDRGLSFLFVYCSRMSVYISQWYSEWAASVGLESMKFNRSWDSAGILSFVGVVCVVSII
jgi:hypothetical protein